jgi:hypothetical protein
MITTGYHKKKTEKDVEHFEKCNAHYAFWDMRIMFLKNAHPLRMKSYNEKCALQLYNKFLMSLHNSDLQDVELALCGNKNLQYKGA